MATIRQKTDSVGSGSRFWFEQSGDTYVIEKKVKVETIDEEATIWGGMFDQTIVVKGSAFGQGNVMTLLGEGNTVRIDTKGLVRTYNQEAGASAILIADGDASITNAGRIVANGAIGVTVSGDGNTIENTGSIKGASGVVLGHVGSAGDKLVNTGTIAAGVFDDFTQNGRRNNGVYAEGDDTVIVNKKGGVISAVSSEGAGVAIGGNFVAANHGGDGSRVDNRGTITSKEWYGVDFFNMHDVDAASLVNSGTIRGGAGSFRGNDIGETVVNKGKMVGDVLLNAGDDIFRGSNGVVDGRIFGGAGADTILGGKGKDRIFGESGADRLDGGKGSDRLTGGAEADTFVFSTGYGKDTIADMQTGIDAIDLSDWNGINNLKQLKNHASNHGDDVWIVKGKDTLIIEDMRKGDLVAGDFDF